MNFIIQLGGEWTLLEDVNGVKRLRDIAPSSFDLFLSEWFDHVSRVSIAEMNSPLISSSQGNFWSRNRPLSGYQRWPWGALGCHGTMKREARFLLLHLLRLKMKFVPYQETRKNRSRQPKKPKWIYMLLWSLRPGNSIFAERRRLKTLKRDNWLSLKPLLGAVVGQWTSEAHPKGRRKDH